MDTIISILGKAGVFEGKVSKAFYECGKLGISSDEYINSTDVLLKNFDGKFYFIGTKEAINIQKEILDTNDKDVHFEEVGDDSLDDVFEKVFELLDDENGKVILDITHGFRHQTISAIFAATLNQFLDKSQLEIIFARELELFKKYEYIYLNEYIEISQISMLLSGFIKTLNFIPVKNLKLLDNKVFEDFSKSLLSNDIKGVEQNYKKLNSELISIKNNPEFSHIEELINKIKTTLEPLDKFENYENYQKYNYLAKMMIEKNYLIIAISYLFESLREYSRLKFQQNQVTKSIKFRNIYLENTSVMDSLSNFKRAGRANEIQKKYPNLYKSNPNFSRVSSVYDEVRKIRNDLAHINHTKDFKDIKLNVNQILFKIETIYKDDVLKIIKK